MSFESPTQGLFLPRDLSECREPRDYVLFVFIEEVRRRVKEKPTRTKVSVRFNIAALTTELRRLCANSGDHVVSCLRSSLDQLIAEGTIQNLNSGLQNVLPLYEYTSVSREPTLSKGMTSSRRKSLLRGAKKHQNKPSQTKIRQGLKKLRRIRTKVKK